MWTISWGKRGWWLVSKFREHGVLKNYSDEVQEPRENDEDWLYLQTKDSQTGAKEVENLSPTELFL